MYTTKINAVLINTHADFLQISFIFYEWGVINSPWTTDLIPELTAVAVICQVFLFQDPSADTRPRFQNKLPFHWCKKGEQKALWWRKKPWTQRRLGKPGSSQGPSAGCPTLRDVQHLIWRWVPPRNNLDPKLRDSSQGGTWRSWKEEQTNNRNSPKNTRNIDSQSRYHSPRVTFWQWCSGGAALNTLLIALKVCLSPAKTLPRGQKQNNTDNKTTPEHAGT